MRGSLDPSAYFSNTHTTTPQEVPEHKCLVFNPDSEYYKCILCDTSHASLSQFECHAAGRKHMKNLFWMEYDEMDKDDGCARMGDPDLGMPPEIECRGLCWFRCSVCETKFYDPQTALVHCESWRHKSRLRLYRPSSGTLPSSTVMRRDVSPRSKAQQAPPIASSFVQGLSQNDHFRKVDYSTGMKDVISSEGMKLTNENERESPSVMPTGIRSEYSISKFASKNAYPSSYPSVSNEFAEVRTTSLPRQRVIPPPPAYNPRSQMKSISLK
jgi:hypothetical protein